MGGKIFSSVFLNFDRENSLKVGMLWVGEGARAPVGVQAGGNGRCRVECGVRRARAGGGRGAPSGSACWRAVGGGRDRPECLKKRIHFREFGLFAGNCWAPGWFGVAGVPGLVWGCPGASAM